MTRSRGAVQIGGIEIITNITHRSSPSACLDSSEASVAAQRQLLRPQQPQPARAPERAPVHGHALVRALELALGPGLA